MKLRLAGAGPEVPAYSGALNMAIDETIVAGLAAARDAGAISALDTPVSVPTLRFYRWAPPCVTIGYFQSMEEEVDLPACRGLGVDAVRRVTGGGAVFHDAELTYSLIVPEGSPLAPADILESYRIVCEGLVRGLARLGVDASFAPINDLAAGGKKLSGNAQTRRRGCLLQHGTILLDVEPERMFAILKVPAEKMKGKLIEDVKARVTGLRGLLAYLPSAGEVAGAIAAGCAEAWAPLGVTLEEGAFTPAELEAAGRLASEKYATPAWNLKR